MKGKPFGADHWYFLDSLMQQLQELGFILTAPSSLCSLLLCHEAFSFQATPFAILAALFWASGVLWRKSYVFEYFS